MTKPSHEPSTGGEQTRARLAKGETTASLAYTCAFDLNPDPEAALALARDLLKNVRKSGLKSPFADALLRRLALERWTKLDRPRPSRLELRDCKETAILLFFVTSWDATYEDLAVALSVTEDRARHLVHRARMEQVGGLMRIPIPGPACRRPRELFSDFQENRLEGAPAEDVAQHLRECRDCALVDRHLRSILAAPGRPLLQAPPELGARPDRHTLSLSFDTVSRTQRRAGLVLLAVGIILGVVQFHPGLNASASDQLDRFGASIGRWRNRGERLAEDLRVLKALALGTFEGRTEELSRTLDEYVNSGRAADSADPKNKPAPDAVLDSRDPGNQPAGGETPRPAEGALSPKNP